MNVFKLIEDNGLTLHGDIEHFAYLVEEAVRAEIAQQEPAAWMHTNGVGLRYFRKNPQDKVFKPQPVYTLPQHWEQA